MITQLNKFQLVQLTNRIFYDFEYLGMITEDKRC